MTSFEMLESEFKIQAKFSLYSAIMICNQVNTAPAINQWTWEATQELHSVITKEYLELSPQAVDNGQYGGGPHEVDGVRVGIGGGPLQIVDPSLRWRQALKFISMLMDYLRVQLTQLNMTRQEEGDDPQGQKLRAFERHEDMMGKLTAGISTAFEAGLVEVGILDSEE